MKRSSNVVVAVAALLVAVLALMMAAVSGQGDTCSAALGRLNVCAAFVVPGAAATTPSADCCAALQGVDHDCICNTLRVASRIPAQCNLAPLSCPAS
ncbi:unnamed protein product [Cuscuta campestris]|uniref:Bifunctional inhibitor/plant lipid transfer protein/seed storage helical domain-containing protein n=1 Tax=Cuscuta campestris TaxID=132261 RepID=A0A484LMP7_9ASTE|nr:unnamed protein product [Cuscuta campestris]